MNRPSYLSVYEWDQMTDEEQRREWQSLAEDEPAAPVRTVPVKPAPPKPKKQRKSMKPSPPVLIPPRTIGEAFALVNGALMRRRVARVEVVQRGGERFSRQVEHFERCGDRVRFGVKTYRAAVVAHYLKTGEMVQRVPRAKPAPRFKAQVREGARVRHLGYFASEEERDAAVFAYKLGIFPNGSKSA